MLGLSANIRINRSFVSRENVIAHHAINRDLISQARIDIVAKFPRVRYMRGKLLSHDQQDSPGESKGHDKNRTWIPKENGCGRLIVGKKKKKRGDAKANRMEWNLFHYFYYYLSFFEHIGTWIHYYV